MATSFLPSDACSPRPARPGAGTAGAFTLLEIMLAVMVLVIITVAVYDFTIATLNSARFSIQMADHDAAFGGMRRLIETQLAAMPTSEAGSLVGVNIHPKNSPQRRDMLQLVCPAGNALLSSDAKGFYQVTLGVRESPRGSGKFFLGMQREPWTSDEDDDDEDATGNPVNKATTNRAPKASLPADWIPLVDGVIGLELAYFDVRLNGWVDKWTDQSALPNLVRMRLVASENQPPYEIIVRVPGGGPRRAVAPMPTLPVPGGPVQGQTGAGAIQNPAVSPGTTGPSHVINRAN